MPSQRTRTPPLERICAACSAPFRTWPYRVAAGVRFCSMACKGVGSQGVPLAKAPKRFEKPCETCGQLIWAYPSQIALGMKRYCSRTCKPGHPKGPSNPSWKGGRSTTSNGYMRVYVGDGAYALEHRGILLAKIGPGTHPCHWCGTPVTWTERTRARAGELVTDHVDRNKTNNDPVNLVPSCQPCNVTRP